MQIRSSIVKLRIVAFFLFLIPTIALIGSLIFHNAIVAFNFQHEKNYTFTKQLPGEKVKFECKEKNSFCENITFERVNKLNKCNKYIISRSTVTETGELLDFNNELNLDRRKISQKLNQKVFLEYSISDQLSKNCISNTKWIRLYNFIPSIFEKFYFFRLGKKINMGTATTVNPIIYGETSISNIVKRYPVKMLFKPLMYVSVILMIAYWYLNNLVFNKLTTRNQNNKFFVLGVLSAIFLLLHVIFLGWNFETELFKKGRRYFVVFFILFEVLAQAYLIRDIFKKKMIISKFLNNTVLILKVIFVISICLSTLAIVIILLVADLSDEVDYILEWNYFLILLLFYFLSSIMWKKHS